MKQLPLFGRIVFVDWHGVLSQDLFWTSILHSSTHPLRPQLELKLGEIFAQESTTHEWMRGMVSSEKIISEMSVCTDRRFSQDFLARRLHVDCTRMRVNVDLFDVLRSLRPMVVVVLATDNMDCFARAFERARASRRRPKPESQRLADWASICDDMVCSSDVGTLKAEDPIKFFGPLLSEYGLSFSDALLIDDRADNCEAFRKQGGSTIRWRMGTSDLEEVIATVHKWIATPRKSAR